MAISFNVPESPTNYVNSLTEFLGVDYNNPLETDIRHSPKMINMIRNNGFLKKRKGVKIKTKIADKPIYGLWQYDVPDEDFDELLIVHCGDKLYEVSKDFSIKTQIMSGLNEVDSYGMFLGDKLVILDGKRAIVYGKYNDSYGAYYMDTVAYIPTTTIGLTPDGMNGTSLESANLLTQFRINRFLADGNNTIFKTDSITLSPDVGDTKVWILNNDTGVWDEQSTDTYTVYSDNRIVFNEAPPAPVVVGADNVKIQFKSTTEDLANLINGCRFCTPFGYQGNNQRLFFSGNKDYPNVDWHSELVESQPDPTYVPDDTFAVIGSQPITGYLRLSDGTLAILKKLSDTDCSIYYRTSNVSGMYDIFPLLSGTKNVGCLSNYTCVNVRNASLFLSEQGVFETVTGEASAALERYADNKSYYINPRLLTEANLESAKAIGINDFYYLCINNNIYVADTSKYTQTKNNTIYQFQWYFLNNIPVRSLLRWNNELVIGDDLGQIKMFGDDYIDEIDENTKYDVYSYFETIPMDFSNPILSKTTRNFTLNYIAPENTKFKFGYRTIDEEEVISDEIYKIVSGNLPNNSSDISYPYGTVLNFDTSIIPETTSNYGIYGYYYGTQTDELKTFLGFYKNENSNLILGIFNIDANNNVTILKEFYNNSYILDKFVLKKLLHGTINDINNDTNIPQLVMSNWNFSTISLSDPTLNNIPQTISVKEKARKIMFLKIFIESEKMACEFDRIYIQYRKAGKYRGE